MNEKLVETTNNQLLRGLILQLLAAARPMGAGVPLILAALRREGIETNCAATMDAIGYLVGKSLATVQSVRNDVLGIRRDIIHITPIGIDVLEGTIAVEGVDIGV